MLTVIYSRRPITVLIILRAAKPYTILTGLFAAIPHTVLMATSATDSYDPGHILKVFIAIKKVIRISQRSLKSDQFLAKLQLLEWLLKQYYDFPQNDNWSDFCQATHRAFEPILSQWILTTCVKDH